jgi:Zn-dependent protease with chaperone function
MDYFQSQDLARRRTGLLVLYFGLAVIFIIASVYMVLAFALRLTGGQPLAQHEPTLADLWDPALLGSVALGTSALIAGGSMYKTAALSGGGHTVAELLGGRLLHPDTNNPDERRLLNIVEEMSIASGLPTPPVYLLENEAGINAFAAGHRPEDAVVAVTRGGLTRLTRDELQGVIGHEFSHILNGDMRLNTRLIGIIFGILVISTVGWLIFRSTTGVVRIGARQNDDDRKGGNPLPFIGLALYIIGYVGVFFGNLIKAAVSRQREYLADASAVQFTRNPDGLASALKKIGALAEGSRINDPHAEEASHLFFGEAVSGFNNLFGLMASHPPLVERIRKLDPSFDGDFSRVSTAIPRIDSSERAPAARAARPLGKSLNIARAVATVGMIEPEHLNYAADLKNSLATPLTDIVREPLGAQAVVFALLIDTDPSVKRRQFDWLNAHALPAAVRETIQILPEVERIAPEAKLPLVELAAPALCMMTPAQFHDFFRSVENLVMADQKTTLFEYTLQRLLMRHVVTRFMKPTPSTVKYATVDSVRGPLTVVLSALARIGHGSDDEANQAFAAAAGVLTEGGLSLELDRSATLDLKAIDAALEELALSTPQLKKRILEACASSIASDGVVTIEEGELLRAVSDCLGCPMPPLLVPASGATAPLSA